MAIILKLVFLKACFKHPVQVRMKLNICQITFLCLCVCLHKMASHTPLGNGKLSRMFFEVNR